MKTPPAEPNNDDLSGRLANWRVAPPADPQFRPAVWERLRRGAPATWTAYLRRHLTVWSVAMALAIMAAGWTGRSFARAKMESRREQMVVSYLGGIDPRVLTNLGR